MLNWMIEIVDLYIDPLLFFHRYFVTRNDRASNKMIFVILSRVPSCSCCCVFVLSIRSWLSESDSDWMKFGDGGTLPRNRSRAFVSAGREVVGRLRALLREHVWKTGHVSAFVKLYHYARNWSDRRTRFTRYRRWTLSEHKFVYLHIPHKMLELDVWNFLPHVRDLHTLKIDYYYLSVVSGFCADNFLCARAENLILL